MGRTIPAQLGLVLRDVPHQNDFCQKHGIKAILYDPTLAGERWDAAFDADRAVAALPELLKRVNHHPAVWG